VLNRLIESRLALHNPKNALEQEHALTEIMQEFILRFLAETDFFQKALFHGGTCLRIFHNLPRFSEDLDFLLARPDPLFAWDPYLSAVRKSCEETGLRFEQTSREKADAAVKKAFLKTDSIGTILLLALPFQRQNPAKIRIKLEIDTRPPEGSAVETHFLSFPAPAAIATQTLSSGFATKTHALLCRPYVKGRDWFDLLWYAERRIIPDWSVLANALYQTGPWQAQKLDVTPEWFFSMLAERIRTLDWNSVREDVRRFLPLSEQKALALWSETYFLYRIDQLKKSTPSARE